MAGASHREVPGGLLLRREEAVRATGGVRVGDAEAECEDGVDNAGTGRVDGDIEVQDMQGQHCDGHRKGKGDGCISGSGGARDTGRGRCGRSGRTLAGGSQAAGSLW